MFSYFFYNIIIQCFTEDCFNETVEAMVHLGIDTERQNQIFWVSLLLLLNDMEYIVM